MELTKTTFPPLQVLYALLTGAPARKKKSDKLFKSLPF